MIALVIRRLLQLPLVLATVLAVTFALVWLIPGNPMENEGRQPPPEIAAAMARQYALDSPVSFFGSYLARVSGAGWVLGWHDRPFDLGPSLRHPDWTVNEIIAAGFPVSASLGLGAMAIALVIGTVAGLIGGLRPGSWADAATQGVALVGISLPSFVVGSLFLVLFAAKLRMFPIAGWGSLSHAILPMVVLSLPFAAYIARLLRFGLVEQMSTDHLRTARAKGLSRAQAAWRHALKNAFLPVLSYLGPATAAAMTGSFVVEKVFAIPGLGRHFVEAVLGKDITLVMGVVLVYATLLVVLNLAVDLLYAWIDPRIELAGSAQPRR
ncbi:MAG: ABC transporter permease [Phycisphaerales bacterium]|nr:ABC transporter permease [Phycisphaerales bacterium]